MSNPPVLILILIIESGVGWGGGGGGGEGGLFLSYGQIFRLSHEEFNLVP